jgi:hypothetical protein
MGPSIWRSCRAPSGTTSRGVTATRSRLGAGTSPPGRPRRHPARWGPPGGRSQRFVSDGTVTGAIQVAGDGRPIVLLVDQTTGGYPSFGAVAHGGKVRPAGPGNGYASSDIGRRGRQRCGRPSRRDVERRQTYGGADRTVGRKVDPARRLVPNRPPSTSGRTAVDPGGPTRAASRSRSSRRNDRAPPLRRLGGRARLSAPFLASSPCGSCRASPTSSQVAAPCHDGTGARGHGVRRAVDFGAVAGADCVFRPQMLRPAVTVVGWFVAPLRPDEQVRWWSSAAGRRADAGPSDPPTGPWNSLCGSKPLSYGARPVSARGARHDGRSPGRGTFTIE